MIGNNLALMTVKAAQRRARHSGGRNPPNEEADMVTRASKRVPYQHGAAEAAAS
jgi:hypothetical protein